MRSPGRNRGPPGGYVIAMSRSKSKSGRRATFICIRSKNDVSRARLDRRRDGVFGIVPGPELARGHVHVWSFQRDRDRSDRGAAGSRPLTASIGLRRGHAADIDSGDPGARKEPSGVLLRVVVGRARRPRGRPTTKSAGQRRRGRMVARRLRRTARLRASATTSAFALVAVGSCLPCCPHRSRVSVVHSSDAGQAPRWLRRFRFTTTMAADDDLRLPPRRDRRHSPAPAEPDRAGLSGASSSGSSRCSIPAAA